MIPEYLAEQIENWVSEFPSTDAARDFPENAEAHAPAILSAFLKAACERAGGDLSAIESPHLSRALLEDVARLDVPADVQAHVPGMIRAFLERLETDGRLADGRLHGAAVAAAGPAYLQAATGKPATYRNPGSRIGPNDPCPCGSGRKYKKCCMR